MTMLVPVSVESVVVAAAGIETDRGGLQLDAARTAALVAACRGQLVEGLRRAGYAGALPIAEAALARLAGEVGGRDDAGPRAFDVRFRPLEAAADGGPVLGATSLSGAEVAALDGSSYDGAVNASASPESPADARKLAKVAALRAELTALEDHGANGNGGHA